MFRSWNTILNKKSHIEYDPKSSLTKSQNKLFKKMHQNRALSKLCFSSFKFKFRRNRHIPRTLGNLHERVHTKATSATMLPKPTKLLERFNLLSDVINTWLKGKGLCYQSRRRRW